MLSSAPQAARAAATSHAATAAVSLSLPSSRASTPGESPLRCGSGTASDTISLNGSLLSGLGSATSDFASMKSNLVAGVAKVRERLRHNMSRALKKVQEKVRL